MKSIHIEDENTYNVTVNGTTLEILTVWYYDDSDDSWRSTNTISFKMKCANNFQMIASGGGYLPVIPNVDPPLKPNQPNQRMKIPNAPNVKLWP